MKQILHTLIISVFVITLTKAQELPSYVPTDGLVAYYPFNGNANDASGNGNNGEVNGATLTTDKDGNDNNAYIFSVNNSSGWGASQNSITIDTPTIPNNNSFTMSAWVNLAEKPSPFDNRPHTIMGRWDGNGTAIFRHQIDYNGNISTNLLEGSTSNITQGGTLSYGNWEHVLISYDGSFLHQYQNGVLVNEKALNIQLNTSNTNLTIGELHMSNGHWYLFSGKIDEIGYWNRALSQQEVQNIYNSSSTNGGDILLNGTVSAENHQIKNVADPTDAQDAVTIAYLESKLDALIDRIELLEGEKEVNCGESYFEDFNSCDLSNYNTQGGSISSTNNGKEGCGVYMTHYAGQDSNNFYAIDRKFLYGTYELDAIADNGISDNIVYLLQQEELTGGYTFSFRPNNTDNPGWSIFKNGETYAGEDSFPVSRGNWYNIKIELLQNSLKIWINDTILFETASITHPTEVSGYFKVGVAFSGAFDNLKFTPDFSICQ